MENLSKFEKIENILAKANHLELTVTIYQVCDAYSNAALELVVRLNQFDTVESIKQKLYDVFLDLYGYTMQRCNDTRKMKKVLMDKTRYYHLISNIDLYSNTASQIKEVLDE